MCVESRPLGGVGVCSPRKFENLHTLRLLTHVHTVPYCEGGCSGVIDSCRGKVDGVGRELKRREDAHPPAGELEGPEGGGAMC